MMSGGSPIARSAGAGKIAPSRQWAVRSRSTRRGDHAVVARWYGIASRKRWIPTGVLSARSRRSSAGVNPSIRILSGVDGPAAARGGTMDRDELQKALRHRPRPVLSSHVQQVVHGGGAVGRFNTWLALHPTRTVGTIWIPSASPPIAPLPLPP